MEKAKKKAKTFLKSSSLNDAKRLKSLLNQLVKDLEIDTNSKLWSELVPSNMTKFITKLRYELKDQINSL